MRYGVVTAAFCVAAVLAAVSGCGRQGRDLTATGQVVVEPVASETVRWAWAEVWQEGEEVVVEGRLARRGCSSCPVLGHVDVTILDADGKVIRQASSPVMGIRRSTPGTGLKLTPFALRMKLTPPADARAVLAYHGGGHEGP